MSFFKALFTVSSNSLNTFVSKTMAKAEEISLREDTELIMSTLPNHIAKHVSTRVVATIRKQSKDEGISIERACEYLVIALTPKPPASRFIKPTVNTIIRK